MVIVPNDVDIELALGSEDYEYLQEYMEEHSKRMNERKFVDKYEKKSMSQRLHSERTADVFEIEERRNFRDEESQECEYYD